MVNIIQLIGLYYENPQIHKIRNKKITMEA